MHKAHPQQTADAAACDKFPRFANRWRSEKPAGATRHLQIRAGRMRGGDFAGLGLVQHEGLFAQHMFPCCHRRKHHLTMQKRRRRDVNRLHRRTRQQFPVIGKNFCATQCLRFGTGGIHVHIRHRDDP